jgi:hypothetical protein
MYLRGVRVIPPHKHYLKLHNLWMRMLLETHSSNALSGAVCALSVLPQTFIEAVDAVDNGVGQWDISGPPRYVNNTTLSARVGQLNPR